MASRDHAHAAAGTRADSGATFWTPSELEAPPTDGPFWAWLHQTGIRKMVWRVDYYEGDEPGDQGAYVLHDEDDETYEPEFWAPLSAIADPANEWAHLKTTGEVS